MHAVTVMGLKAKARPTISVDTVLTSTPADRFVSFYRISVGPQGVKPLKSGRAMTILARPGAQSMIDPVKMFPDIRGPPLGMGSVADPVEIYPPSGGARNFILGGAKSLPPSPFPSLSLPSLSLSPPLPSLPSSPFLPSPPLPLEVGPPYWG